MNFDFTLEMYNRILTKIQNSNYEIVTFKDFLDIKPKKNHLILRHDLCNSPQNSIPMAKLENAMGIKSSYYFRIQKKYKYDNTLIEINNLEHEIGLHYDALDKADGNMQKVEKILEHEINLLNNYTNVNTISMHGNPMTKNNNLDIWKHFKLSSFNVQGDTYLSINAKDTIYITDTGRSFNEKYNIKDKIEGSKTIPNLNKSKDLIQFFDSESYDDNIQILFHPIRWSTNYINYIKQYSLDIIKNYGKKIYQTKHRYF